MKTYHAETSIHPSDAAIADLLADRLGTYEKKQIRDHIAGCDECLIKVVSAHESVAAFKKDDTLKRKGKDIMKKVNLYLALAIISFSLSFITPRYFVQLLVATMILGLKWVADSKSAKMLIMIYEAWRSGGEKEASRVIKSLEETHKHRF